MRAVLGLGSNLGDRWAFLDQAIGRLVGLDPSATWSRVYETEPVGGPDGQGPYLNLVVVVHTELDPEALLEFAHELESEAGRVRLERFGPRTLDVDIVDYEGVVRDDPLLTLPHPRWQERAFVLAPLSEVAPDLLEAGWMERLGGAAAVARAARPIGTLLTTASRT